MTEKRSILVLDDDPVVRFLLTETLSISGYQVSAHGSWVEAQKALATGAFHLAMVDLIMPDISGFEVIEAVHSSHPSLPVILLSANADKAVSNKAKEVKPDAILEKPWNSQQLLALIQRLTDPQAQS